MLLATSAGARAESAPEPPGVILPVPGAVLPVPDDMLPVPGGTFTMGADGVGERDEQPAHSVTLPGFLLDKTEVTNAKYSECVSAGACKPYRDDVARGFHAGPEAGFRGAEQPVVGVSWFDAGAYCAFRSKRLPREAEWERAARGDDGRKYAWGNSAPDPEQLACFGRKVGAKGATTMPVGSYPLGRGPYGHFDLTGNVWEWTADLYDPMAYSRDGRDQGVLAAVSRCSSRWPCCAKVSAKVTLDRTQSPRPASAPCVAARSTIPVPHSAPRTECTIRPSGACSSPAFAARGISEARPSETERDRAKPTSRPKNALCDHAPKVQRRRVTLAFFAVNLGVFWVFEKSVLFCRA